MIAFLKANSAFEIKPTLSETTAKVKIVAGEREEKLIRMSAVLLNQTIPGSRLEILPGLCHGICVSTTRNDIRSYEPTG